MENTLHQPVMLDQVVGMLRPRSGGKYVDLTLGLGGHARRILEESAPDGSLLGLERDPQALEHARRMLSPFKARMKFVHGRHSELPLILRKIGWSQVDGMLADLGISSLQLDDPNRGFGFQKAGPLDMRMDPTRDLSLGEHLAKQDERSLAGVLQHLGEVNQPRLIARRILNAFRDGKLIDTRALARVASEARSRRKIHPATRVFLALRMMVNQELEELSSLLSRLPEPLAQGGRVVFISFHSLEDRLIKRRLKELLSPCTCPRDLPVCRCDRKPIMHTLTRRPKRPSVLEVVQNPRARSARLRAAERVAA